MVLAIILSIAGGVAYRLGGYGPPFNTKVRDLGLPTCMAAYFAITGHWHWILIICFGLCYGAQTTYNKWSQRLIGVKTNDVMWVGWLVTGLAFSFALLPYAWATGHWMGFLWRTLIGTGGTGAVSELYGKDYVEEGFRGGVQIITLPLLLLP